MSNGEYSQKISGICDYIIKNLDTSLELAKLAEVANLSKFHFHRIFSFYVGVSPFLYIQLMRFKKASHQLVFQKEIKIIDIALDAKFESHEAFSRAFKKVFGVSPMEFRKKPDWESWHQKYIFNKIKGEVKMNVEIIEFPETQVAFLEHQGAPALLNETVLKFIEWRKATGISPVTSSKTFGIVYSDPNTTEPEMFKFDVCGEVSKSVPENNFGVGTKTILGGRCAKVKHIGPHEKMDEVVYSLYRDWLPESGEKLRDFPLFFQYLNLAAQVNDSELETDIYLPLV